MLTKRGELVTPRLPSSDMTISFSGTEYDLTWSIGEIAGALAFKVLNLSVGGKGLCMNKPGAGWSGAALRMCYAQKCWHDDEAGMVPFWMAGEGGRSDGNAKAWQYGGRSVRRQ
ncbi:hypothetical protein GGI1_04292 [Acidithiobacillus sp. GGI-221]|nr:hypothetical protein GGI1_04292 [Acidithiobacillus sp. GGI-221]